MGIPYSIKTTPATVRAADTIQGHWYSMLLDGNKFSRPMLRTVDSFVDLDGVHMKNIELVDRDFVALEITNLIKFKAVEQ